jgi:multidrug resistance efflux pump
MNETKRPPIPVIILVVLLVVAAIVYFGFFANRNGQNGQLTASGTIEAVDISIAPETSGKAVEVLVDEGDAVKTGDVLLRLDDTLLQAQHKSAQATLESARTGAVTAQAALASAQTQYDIALSAALHTDQTTRQTDWKTSKPPRFTQPGWYFTREEQIQAAQTEIDAAKTSLDEANTELDKVEKELDKAEFLRAEKRLAEARAAYLVALDVYTRAQNSTGGEKETVGRYNLFHYGKGVTADTDLIDASRDLYDDATDELDSAQEAYDDLLTTRAAQDVLEQRAKVSVAIERYYSALDLLRELQTGDYSLSVVAAQNAVNQARAAADQSAKAIEQAQAQLDLIGAQISKLVISAPANGIILTRNIEPGEVAAAGSVVLTLAESDSLTITVYVPEDRYGEITLGQPATVTVDSFPGQTFTATVTYIADKAEFTPRNVQTAEGRKTTVFAIKLRVTDTESKLKPGMPADVTFK